jgi:hypothetical protein
MLRPRGSNLVWTFDKVLTASRQYQTVSEWVRGSPSSAQAARRDGYFKEATAHMSRPKRDPWTKAEVIADARKYITKSEWGKASSGARTAAFDNDWYEEATAHMSHVLSWGERTVSRILTQHDIKFVHQACFDDLVGPTGKHRLRFDFHVPSLDLFIEYHGEQHFNTESLMSSQGLVERDALKKVYAENHGVYLMVRGEDEKAIREAILTVVDDLSCGLAELVQRELTQEEEKQLIVLGIWTFDNTARDALNYTSISAWARASPAAYASAHRNKWFEIVTAHMTRLKRHNWTKEEVLTDALNYLTIGAWERGSLGAYKNACRDKQLLSMATAHMTRLKRHNWTKEEVLVDAQNHLNISVWQKTSSGAYEAARREGWFDEATSHMRRRSQLEDGLSS